MSNIGNESLAIDFQGALMQSPIPLLLVNITEFSVHFVNEKYLQLTRSPGKEILGRSVFDLDFFHDLKDRLSPILLKAIESGEPQQLVEKKAIDGIATPADHHMEISIQPIKNSVGKLYLLMLSLTEVRAEMSTPDPYESGDRDNEENYRSLINNAAVGIAHVSLDGDWIFMNSKMTEILGYTMEDLMQKTFQDITHPDDIEKDLKKVKALIEGKAPSYHMEKRYIRNDNSLVWAKLTVSLVKDQYGSPSYFVSIVEEITEQKNAQIALEQSEFLKTSIIEASPSITYIYDCARRCNVFASAQTSEILGYSAMELRSMPANRIQMMLHPDDEAKATKRFLSFAQADSDDVIGLEYRLKHKLGHWVWLHDRARVFKRSESGEVIQILGVATDITERKLLEEKIYHQFEELENIYLNAPIGLALFDMNLNFQRLNERLAEINGIPVADHIGRNIREIVPDLAHQVEDVFNQVISTGNSVLNVEFSGTTSRMPGVLRIWNESWYPLKNDTGEMFAVSVVVEDITDRRMAEEKLANSERYFRQLADTVPVVIWITRPNGLCSYVNKKWHTFTGQTDHDTKDFGWQNAIHPEHRTMVLENFLSAHKNETVFSAQYLLRHRSGVYRWVTEHGSPKFGQGGKFEGLIGTVLDIHEQKIAEEKIKESENRFRTLAETLPQLVWMMNGHQELEYLSESWKKYTGVDNFLDAWRYTLHPDDKRSLLRSIKSAVKKQEGFTHEIRLRNRSGRYRWFYSVGEPVKSSTGVIIKWIGSLTDIEEQKKFREKLEDIVDHRTRELKRSNEDLQQFAHVASHDLKEPVRKVRTFLSRLKDELGNSLTDKASQYMDKIETSSKRIAAMIDGVLQYSILDSVENPMEQVNMMEIVENIIHDLEIPITEKQAIFIYKNLPVINGSKVLLYQLFYNLISNSLKFSRTDVILKISIRYEQSSHRGNSKNSVLDHKLIIEDNGIGFSPGDADVIFQPFSRLHPKHEYEGTGLGLALCRKIVERYGGQMFAYSVPGQGATFTILLPDSDRYS
jgi:PAS domain S-box-containing protein